MHLAAPNMRSALIIHLAEGATNLAQQLTQQGYELAEEWEGPASSRAAGQPLMDMAHLDLTQTNQSGTVLFLQTVAQLRSPFVVVSENPPRTEGNGAGHRGRSLLLKRIPVRNGSAFAARRQPPTTREPAEAESRLLQELRAQSSLQMAGGIAHDVNNFLMVVTTCADLLRREKLSDDGRSCIEDLCAASNRAAALLGQLAQLCRNQLEPPQILDLNHLILDVHGVLSRLLGDEVRFAMDLERCPCMVKVNPRQLEQVILNLAVNARDAMPQKGVFYLATHKVQVSGFASRPHNPQFGQFVRLVVRDSGCGMSDAVKSRIFEPFFTTKTQGKGTGVGLATVDRVIKEFDGQIEVDSTPDAGTTFTIYLPEAIPETDTPATDC